MVFLTWMMLVALRWGRSPEYHTSWDHFVTHLLEQMARELDQMEQELERSTPQV